METTQEHDRTSEQAHPKQMHKGTQSFSTAPDDIGPRRWKTS
jgi:hypothetical protein